MYLSRSPRPVKDRSAIIVVGRQDTLFTKRVDGTYFVFLPDTELVRRARTDTSKLDSFPRAHMHRLFRNSSRSTLYSRKIYRIRDRLGALPNIRRFEAGVSTSLKTT